MVSPSLWGLNCRAPRSPVFSESRKWEEVKERARRGRSEAARGRLGAGSSSLSPRGAGPLWLRLPGIGGGGGLGGAGALNLPQGEEKPGCGPEAVSCRAGVNWAGIINQVSEMSLNPFSRITVAATRHFLPLPSLFPTPNTSLLFRFFARFVSLTEGNIHSCTLVTTPGLAGGGVECIKPEISL